MRLLVYHTLVLFGGPRGAAPHKPDIGSLTPGPEGKQLSSLPETATPGEEARESSKGVRLQSVTSGQYCFGDGTFRCYFARADVRYSDTDRFE